MLVRTIQILQQFQSRDFAWVGRVYLTCLQASKLLANPPLQDSRSWCKMRSLRTVFINGNRSNAISNSLRGYPVLICDEYHLKIQHSSHLLCCHFYYIITIVFDRSNRDRKYSIEYQTSSLKLSDNRKTLTFSRKGNPTIFLFMRF
jgi:hypothetical protein